jgi:hypothetical protein
MVKRRGKFRNLIIGSLEIATSVFTACCWQVLSLLWKLCCKPCNRNFIWYNLWLHTMEFINNPFYFVPQCLILSVFKDWFFNRTQYGVSNGNMSVNNEVETMWKWSWPILRCIRVFLWGRVKITAKTTRDSISMLIFESWTTMFIQFHYLFSFPDFRIVTGVF